MSATPRPASDLLRHKNRPETGRDTDLATLREVFAATPADGAATGFVLGHLRPGPVLWVTDRVSLKEGGRLYLSGLPRSFEILMVTVNRAQDVLWALEEGLGCPELSAVVGEVWGDPPSLDFTASKRLALRAEAHAVSCWLIRRAAMANLSAARERWRLAPLPSLPHAHDIRAPGAAQWQAELFRSRLQAPGTWVAAPRGAEVVMDHETPSPPARIRQAL